jgi:hypothetical protein
MVARWVAGIALLALGALVVVGNVTGILHAKRTGRGFSSVPFVAATLGLLGTFILPITQRRWLIPAVLLLDFTVPAALLAGTWILFRRERPPH